MRGVQLIENVKTGREDIKRGKVVKAVYGTSIFVCAWAASLDASTTYSLQPLATSSFGAHSSLATINIANGIIGAVGNPILAKFADLISRTFIYIISVFFYTVGYIIAASSQTATVFIVGLGIATIGIFSGLEFIIFLFFISKNLKKNKTGVDFVNTLIVIDFTPKMERICHINFGNTFYHKLLVCRSNCWRFTSS